MLRWFPLFAMLWASCAILAGAQPAERTLAGKTARLDSPPGSQAAERVPSHEVGDTLTLGAESVHVRRDGKRLFVAAKPDAEPALEALPGKPVSVTIGSGAEARKVTLRFERDEKDVWRYFSPEARDFDVGGVPFRLHDLDADGRFTLEADGYAAYGARMCCPLEAELVVGTWRVAIRSIAPDGAKMVAEIVAVEGSKSQLDTLLKVNRLRALNGLPHVRLDPELSRACTLHAEWLRLNNWTGQTDPHDEPEGSNGYTKEGKQAASRSVIQRVPPVASVDSFWRTYYHRDWLMNPVLRRIGVNASPDNISVLDSSTGVENAEAAAWSDPVIVPGDGGLEFPVRSESERPKDPVSDFGNRGGALMLRFRGAVPADVKGSLVRLQGRAEVPVPTLVADSGGKGSLFGIVPESPLSASTTYRATFTWTSAGVPVRRVVTFQTK